MNASSLLQSHPLKISCKQQKPLRGVVGTLARRNQMLSVQVMRLANLGASEQAVIRTTGNVRNADTQHVMTGDPVHLLD